MGVGKLRDSSLVAIALGSKRRMICAATSYLAKHPAPRVLSDLAQHQCIATIELQPWTFQTGQQERTLRVVAASPLTASKASTMPAWPTPKGMRQSVPFWRGVRSL